MPISKAQQDAVTRYNNKAYESICLRVPAGRKQLVDKLADDNNMSTNGLVNAILAQACGLTYEVWNDPDYQYADINNPKVNFMIKLEPGRDNYIKKIAQEHGITANQLVNAAIAKYLGFDLDIWTGDKQRNKAAGQQGEQQTSQQSSGAE